jgi:hypothetical protein
LVILDDTASVRIKEWRTGMGGVLPERGVIFGKADLEVDCEASLAFGA